MHDIKQRLQVIQSNEQTSATVDCTIAAHTFVCTFCMYDYLFSVEEKMIPYYSYGGKKIFGTLMAEITCFETKLFIFWKGNTMVSWAKSPVRT